MRIRPVLLVTLLGVLASGCAATPRAGAQRELDPDLAALAWLAGSWITEPAGENATVVEEHWMQPVGGTMIAMNRTVAGGRTAFFEYLRLEQRGGAIFYLASPAGRQPPTPFRLVEHNNQSAVFENPQHDYPQRITYRREGDNLHGRVEGERDGKTTFEEWTWKRMAGE